MFQEPSASFFESRCLSREKRQTSECFDFPSNCVIDIFYVKKYYCSTYVDQNFFWQWEKHDYAAACRSHKKIFRDIARPFLVHLGRWQEDPRFGLVKKIFFWLRYHAFKSDLCPKIFLSFEACASNLRHLRHKKVWGASGGLGCKCTTERNTEK